VSKYPPRAASPYRLPFRVGLIRWCCQGNDGVVSHFAWQRYAYDFAMPVGSDVIAARGGVVEVVSVAHDGHGNWNNEIGVRHDDGTFAYYLHLIRGGSYVRVGQRVEQGDLLAASGDVGVSAAPHLHFVVYGKNDTGAFVGLPVTFADVPGDGIPREFHRYTSGNGPTASP
jgi:murein DD-endopeptidase MepM/ murein hydrolase activator NlpD